MLSFLEDGRGLVLMKTATLKKTIATFRSVISYNNIRAITDLVEMYSADGVLHLGSTDNRTTIIATVPNETNFDNVIVSINFLNNLLKLTTSEEVTLNVIEKVRKKDSIKFLEFKGNGKFTIPLQYDENGEEFYLPLFMPEHNIQYAINKKDFDLMIKRNKFSILESEDSLNLYHFEKDKVITTDSFVISCTNYNSNSVRDIPSNVMTVFSNIPSDFYLSFVEDGVRMSCENCEIFTQYKEKESFPLEVVSPFLQDTDYIASFSINKKELIQALKRQHLFKLAYENPSVVIDIGANITLQNKQESTKEELNIINYQHNKHTQVTFNTDVLIEVLKNMGETIDFYVNEETAKLVDNYGFYIISVADDL